MAKLPHEIQARPISNLAQDVPTRTIGATPQPSVDFNGPQDELFDWQKVRRLLFFTLRSIRRRPVLFLLIWVGMVVLAVTALWAMPKTYEVQSTILAQKSLKAGGDAWADQPTRTAPELIMRSENLRALIEQTNLLEEWTKHRVPIQRLKDWVMLKINRVPDKKDLLRSLTGLLEKNLVVWTGNDGTVKVKLTWPNPLMAYRLVDAVNQNFLEERHAREVSTLGDEISILEVHAAQLREDIEKQVVETQRLREQRSGAQRGAASNSRSPPAPVASAPVDPEVVNMRVTLEAKRRAIADIEEMRRRRVVELQTRLSEQRAVYSESHPVLRDLEESIGALKNESPQLAALRQEEAMLRDRLGSRRGGGSTGASSLPAIPSDLFRDLREGEDPLVDYARTQLRLSIVQYAQMRDRINAARIELDTAQAGFKYYFSVLHMPEVPRNPIKPNSQMVIAAAFVAGLLLALFATSAADLRSGLLLETWQLESAIGRDQSIIEVRVP
jgi:uncharacterized protein involved in exopolysaccharide biosynthesis